MEKFIELLYEYNKTAENKLGLITSVKELGEEMWFDKKKEVMKYECEIISKSYGFIKWLVDNNKIDRLTFCTIETPSSKYEDFDLGPETSREDYTNILLMDLAIQDNPMKFLISILK